LQQFALEAHAPPAATQATAVHRGTPSSSGLQVAWDRELPEQQLEPALHELVETLQISPSGLHPIAAAQTPSVLPAEMLQVTGVVPAPGNPALPQQSESRAHTSPVVWQPLDGKQTSAPVGPYAAHVPPQQLPPHMTAGASATIPPHTTPSTSVQAALVEAGLHVP
jgi:hypothetical protein